MRGDQLGVHFHQVGVRQDQQRVTVTACGVSVRDTGSLSPARGAIVTMDCHCESGHLFQLELRFHKGSIFVETRPTGSFDPGKDAERPEELWRD